TSKKPVAQNKKWARTHRTRPPRSEQAVNYTERMVGKQVDYLPPLAAKNPGNSGFTRFKVIEKVLATVVVFARTALRFSSRLPCINPAVG
ncbi:MAG: hypothetical protein ABJB21_10890, partial [bacterium]